MKTELRKCIVCGGDLFREEGNTCWECYRPYQAGKQEALKEVNKIIDECSREGDDMHDDAGKCWVYVEELKSKLEGK